MIRIRESITVACTPGELLDLVMDIERYAELDAKIRPVLWSRRDGDTVEFACRPTLAGLPQPPVIQYMRRVGDERIDISVVPPPANRLAHVVASFRARAEVVPVDGGTRYTRTLEFRFTPVLRWLLEPLFRRRLRPEVVDELQLVQSYFAS